MIARDLHDYSDRFQSLHALLANSGHSPDEIRAFLSWAEPDGIVFLLHDETLVWEPASEIVGTLNIEDETRSPDPLEAIIQGYLVANQLAFASTLELLETAFRDEWPQWGELWGWY
jgi:hypothetical protein